jgi:hypothetical protein
MLVSSLLSLERTTARRIIVAGQHAGVHALVSDSDMGDGMHGSLHTTLCVSDDALQAVAVGTHASLRRVKR